MGQTGPKCDYCGMGHNVWECPINTPRVNMGWQGEPFGNIPCVVGVPQEPSKQSKSIYQYIIDVLTWASVALVASAVGYGVYAAFVYHWSAGTLLLGVILFFLADWLHFGPWGGK